MDITVIDTLRYARRLRDAGVEGRQAEAMARAINDELATGVATREDLDRSVETLSRRLDRSVANLRGEIDRQAATLRERQWPTADGGRRVKTHFSYASQYVAVLIAALVGAVLAVLLLRNVDFETARMAAHTVMLTAIGVALAGLRYPKMWPWLHRRLRVSFRLGNVSV